MSHSPFLRLLRILPLLCMLLLPLPLFAAADGADGAAPAVLNVPAGTDEGVASVVTAEGSAPETLPVMPVGGDVFAEPAPVRSMPEPVTLRAEFQPTPAEPAILEEKDVPDSSQTDLRPVLTMLPDAQGFSFEEASVRFGEFQPFDAWALLRQNGALWLHLALDNVEHPAPGGLRLDLGRQIPPHTEVWLSSDGIRWKLINPEAEGLYNLAHAGDDGQALIRLDGMPGLWFRPMLRPLSQAMHDADRKLQHSALILLCLLSALCFFLCLGLRGESRFWTFVLAASAAVQALWAVPATADGIGSAALPGIFAAGIALLMLPHIGRVLMRTRLVSPFADVFFMILALLGVCAALLPLLPGMAWAAHLLTLWPLAAVPCILPAMILLLRGVQGSLPFTLACLCMGGGALTALWGFERGLDAVLWGTGILAGPALGLLCLIAASPCRSPRNMSTPSASGGSDASTAPEDGLSALRGTVRNSVEELLDEACKLDQALNRAGVNALHVDIMARADGMTAAARRLAEKTMVLQPPVELPGSSECDFDLRQIIQSVFSSVFAEAESKGLGLSWYVAPHLGRRYRGDSSRLMALLSLMLSDSVRSSSGGAVSLRVRRANSTHPGHLLFSISDNGEGLPPHGRSSSLLARVWEFASANGGELFVNSGPEGTELGFSMICAAYEEDGITEKPVPGSPEDDKPRKLVIAAAARSVNRQMIAHHLSGLDFRIWEARDAAEAAALYAVEPAALVIFDGSLAEDDMVQSLASIRMNEGEQSLTAVPFLLLASDALQAERMGKAGCDEALLPPFIRKDLRAMARWLTAPVGSLPKPVLASQRVTVADVLAGAKSGTMRFQRKEGLKPLRAESAEKTQESLPDITERSVAPESPAPEERSAATSSIPTPAEEHAPAPADSRSPMPAPSSPEDLEDPVDRMLLGMDALKSALAELDSYSVRRGSAVLAALADGYGMHTLADMARCFRAAWEEGDIEAASQIVEEMRSEALRARNA
ncbi:MAG: hypothetical protein IJB29_04050 [Mailhella sp.]|nr:hypothetical protein [Mailhella sp.]